MQKINKILERRLRVSVSNSQDSCLSVTTVTGRSSATSWADMMKEESLVMPLLLEGLVEGGKFETDPEEVDASVG